MACGVFEHVYCVGHNIDTIVFVDDLTDSSDEEETDGKYFFFLRFSQVDEDYNI